MEEQRREKAISQVQDVIEVRPEIMQLLEAFDAPMKQSKGSSRALCMLKKNAKKRKRAECDLGGNPIAQRPP